MHDGARVLAPRAVTTAGPPARALHGGGAKRRPVPLTLESHRNDLPCATAPVLAWRVWAVLGQGIGVWGAARDRDAAAVLYRRRPRRLAPAPTAAPVLAASRTRRPASCAMGRALSTVGLPWANDHFLITLVCPSCDGQQDVKPYKFAL